MVIRGSDPQRLAKRESHITEQKVPSMDKPGYVKPGNGRNQDIAGKDAMPGFEGLTTYKSTQRVDLDNRQSVYPPANKD